MRGWFLSSSGNVLAVVVGVVVLYFVIILATRLAGLRSFAKMSSFDFAMTIAIGTVVGSTAIARDPPLVQGLFAIAVLYLLQYSIARLRLRFERFAGWLDNMPVLLVENGRIIDENLRRVRVTHEELRAAVRAARIRSVAEVAAAVMETTGDITVVPGPERVDPDLLRGVRRQV